MSSQQQSADRSPPAEERVSVLVGDRLCTACGYNLTGQPVVRESHYQMLIVRCPECAAVASVQEYPLLGKWATRWAMVLTAIWLLVLLVLWIGNSAAIFGLSMGAAAVGWQDYSNWIGARYHEDQAAPTAAGSTGNVTFTSPGGQVVTLNPVDFHLWWTNQDHAELLTMAGGYFGVINWQALYFWFFLALLSFVCGCVWATVLLARGPAARVLYALPIAAVALVFASIPISFWHSDRMYWAEDAAAQHLGTHLLLGGIGFATIVLAVGLLVGRKVTRLVVRALLPPRLRSSLAILWITDGLMPPAPQRRS